MQITDGTGTSRKARVTDHNEVATFARSGGLFQHLVASEFIGWCVSTGFISLTTTASFNGLLYLLNTGIYPVRLWGLTVSGGSATQQWEIIKNPSTGTLISGGTTVTPVAMNFASGKTLSATVKKGANGSTITDGTFLCGNAQGSHMHDFDGALILPTNASIAILCKPSAACDAIVNLLVSQTDIHNE